MMLRCLCVCVCVCAVACGALARALAHVHVGANVSGCAHGQGSGIACGHGCQCGMLACGACRHLRKRASAQVVRLRACVRLAHGEGTSSYHALIFLSSWQAAQPMILENEGHFPILHQLDGDFTRRLHMHQRWSFQSCLQSFDRFTELF